MNWLDIVIVIIIAMATIMGLRTGMIKTFLSLAGIVAGAILAGRYYVPFSEQLTFLSNASVAKVVAFAIILIGVMVVTRVLSGLLERITSGLLLGWVNRLGGAVFGLMLGAILCGALLAVLVRYLGITDIVAASALASLLLDRLPLVLALLPDEFEGVRSFFQ